MTMTAGQKYLIQRGKTNNLNRFEIEEYVESGGLIYRDTYMEYGKQMIAYYTEEYNDHVFFELNKLVVMRLINNGFLFPTGHTKHGMLEYSKK